MTHDEIEMQRIAFEKLMRKEGDVRRDDAGSYANPRVWTAWRFWLLSIDANTIKRHRADHLVVRR